jgi:hypothetical protein
MDLEGPKVEHAFNTEIAAIHIVSEEKVSGFSRITADLKELHEIVVLAVNVTTDCDRSIHFEKVRFGSQYLGTLIKDEESLLLGQATFAVEVLL